MSNELATVYAALILADAGVEITADKITAITKAAGVPVEAIWAKIFSQALAGQDVMGLLSKIGAGAAAGPAAAGAGAAAGGAAAAAAPVEEEPEEEEEEDEDMGFGLFD
ncbi:60s acidic ribosomal protein-domain-containing protein [Catenaria anguillulae PL171]|uniref:60s acidic ribosomal protein-domain-containing protein n=1 Tax=Catenaria anguillulae PL171 TaxID=765915 RepID=A0A1Y2HCY1_9FUNG|nr:60s acidic ribosomal protein-domain-containing protein [Catenaria anguillulae PL171]ORZ31553.1 60s acidic ribosomal protein-domain-containing protein [Catenaria anguillulae PL171]